MYGSEPVVSTSSDRAFARGLGRVCKGLRECERGRKLWQVVERSFKKCGHKRQERSE